MTQTTSVARLSLDGPQATERLADACANFAVSGCAYLLSGGLGAGKSTFARAFVRRLTGPDEEVPSPTFTLVQVYDTAPCPVWHVDLYRLVAPEEALELGIEEAFAEASVLDRKSGG